MLIRRLSSNRILLGRVAGALTGAMLLPFVAGCDNGHTYEDVNACIAGGVYTAAYCRQGYDEARIKHDQESPLYEDKADCQNDDWDQCDPVTTTTNGSSHTVIVHSGGYYGGYGGSSTYYQPRMSGFTLHAEDTSSPSSSRVAAEPVSRTTGGGMRAYTSGKASSGSAVESVGHGSSVEAAPSHPIIGKGASISRGGFMSGAHGFGIGE